MTARSWSWPEWRRGVGDVRHLLWFRTVTLARPRRVLGAVLALSVTTVLAAVLPALVAASDGTRTDAASLVPAALAAVAFVSVAGAIAGAGGRELLARDAAAVHPAGPVCDHLGALVLAPLNAGWLIQTWALLGLVALAAPGERLPSAQVVTLAWVMTATCVGQMVGWAVEWVRRGPRGVALVRAGIGMTLVVLIGIGAAPTSRAVLVAGPARATSRLILTGDPGPVLLGLLALGAVAALAVVLGGWLALRVARRTPREEGRLETRRHRVRPLPRTDLVMLTRIDRVSVWRSAPLRRGTMLLVLAPGVVAAVGGLDWSTLLLLPGLVASGCVLLFGVNLWCLDGRGLLWRESLPVAPGVVVGARVWVLVEILLGGGLLTLGLGAVRAGVPTLTEALGTLLVLLVVVGQAVSAALRWSLAHPHAVDLRSARATPAPPLAMVGYSIRLATATTFTALAFTGFVLAERLDLMVAAAVVLLGVSGFRVVRAVRAWRDPVRRAGVVAVVAA